MAQRTLDLLEFDGDAAVASVRGGSDTLAANIKCPPRSLSRQRGSVFPKVSSGGAETYSFKIVGTTRSLDTDALR